MPTYDEVFQQSIESPETFWAEAAEGIDWYRRWDRVLDDSDPPFYRWFVGGQLNTCYNAVDRHVEAGRGDQPAIIYDSPVTDTVRVYTYREVRDEVARLAGALVSTGVTKGDTVVIYMPMIPQSLFAMFACARIGAIHSVVFGGFAPHELAVRIDDARPKVVMSASCGIEGRKVIAYKPLLDSAIDQSSHEVERVIIFQRPQAVAGMMPGRDLDWDEAVAGAEPVDCVPVEATDPLYILYTSGTTGIPKGVVRDNGGHAVALHWSMKAIYDIDEGDVFWAASDIGWVVGHSYIVYAPLLKGATTIVYEGKPVGTPDPGAFWRVISQHQAKSMFTAPTAFRAIKKEDPKGEYLGGYDLSRFEILFLAGERTDPDTYHWARELLDRPVIDHWWQTETAWAICGNLMGVDRAPTKPGSAHLPMPGFDVHVVDEDANELPRGRQGVIGVRNPLPPGTFMNLWRNEERFKNSYFKPYPGYYFTGDGGYMDEDGYVYVMGRVDDIINVAGHRLSTGAMEEVVAQHPDVAEAAVFGVEDALKGEVPIGMVVLKAGVERDHGEIVSELVQMVRSEIGPIANFKQAAIVKRLPKTRSGKTLRGTMRRIANGQDYKVPSTIDDPATLEEIEVAVDGIGYGKNR